MCKIYVFISVHISMWYFPRIKVFIEKITQTKAQPPIFSQIDAPEKNGYRQQRIFQPKTLIEKFRAMSPYDFEYSIKDMFEAKWFKTIREPQYRVLKNGKKMPLADNGIDYICEKNGRRCFVQMKTYKGKKQVTIGQIREFNSALQDVWMWENDVAYFITTTIFTKDAEEYAKKKNIRCVDYNKLLQLHDSAKNDSEEYIIKIQTRIERIDYAENAKFTQHMKTCPWCAAPLVMRKGRNSQRKFRWCQNYAKTGCKYVENIKKEDLVAVE